MVVDENVVLKNQNSIGNISNEKINELVKKIYDFNLAVNQQEKYISSKILVQRYICIGYKITQLENQSELKFDSFWKILSLRLKSLGCEYYSRTTLFESRRLYLSYCRFVNVIDNDVIIEDVNIPLRLGKKHLLLIASYCQSILQQDIFINKVVRHSLKVSDLRSHLINGVGSKEKNTLLVLDNLVIKTIYDLRDLKIGSTWNENEIKYHVIHNISAFMKIIFNDSNWGFLPNQNTFIGGKQKFLDLVFYNVVEHKFLIIDLKICSLVSSLDRAKSQMASYVVSYNKGLSLGFQKKTIGLILGKEPTDSLYFSSTEIPENVFYSSFII